MNDVLITIGTGSYNAGIDLQNMIKSILNQSYTNWELILIDDGSNDGSFDTIKHIDDPRIRVYSNNGNIGRAKSLNRVTKLAKGKYIARMDADDLCVPERLEKQLALLENNPELDVVGSGILYLGLNEQILGQWCAPTRHGEICADPNRTFRIGHGTIMGKKSWFEKNPYDEKLPIAIDFNLFFRSHKNSCFGNISEPLYFYRLEQSLSHKKRFITRFSSAKFLLILNWKKRKYLNAIGQCLVQTIKYIFSSVYCLVLGNQKYILRRCTALSEKEKNAYSKIIIDIHLVKIPYKNEQSNI